MCQWDANCQYMDGCQQYKWLNIMRSLLVGLRLAENASAMSLQSAMHPAPSVRPCIDIKLPAAGPVAPAKRYRRSSIVVRPKRPYSVWWSSRSQFGLVSSGSMRAKLVCTHSWLLQRSKSCVNDGVILYQYQCRLHIQVFRKWDYRV